MEFPAALVEAIARARAVAVLTGAGVSAESGIPTFRDRAQGLWAKYDPTQLATPEAFAADPALVSRWYDWRRSVVAGCRPNPGHDALAAWERVLTAAGARCTVLTQNVDRLHHAAGSRDVIELHGTIWVWRCTRCRRSVEVTPAPFGEYPAPCGGGCPGIMRPGVVWFGESLPEAAMAAAGAALEHCDLFLSVGTSAVVFPAAGFVEVARGRAVPTAEINPEPTPISGRVDWSVRRRSGEALPALLRAAGLA